MKSIEPLIEAAGDPAALIALAPRVNGSAALADAYMVRAGELGCMETAARAILEARKREPARPLGDDGLRAPRGTGAPARARADPTPRPAVGRAVK